MGNISEICILGGSYAQPPKDAAVNFTYNTVENQLCQIRKHYE